MRVGCWDCGMALDDKNFERPRSAKTGMKNTVAVCERCFVLWHLKQFKKQQILFDKGELVEIPNKWAAVNRTIKFLEVVL